MEIELRLAFWGSNSLLLEKVQALHSQKGKIIWRYGGVVLS